MQPKRDRAIELRSIRRVTGNLLRIVNCGFTRQVSSESEDVAL